jgi:hypothetical protein
VVLLKMKPAGNDSPPYHKSGIPRSPVGRDRIHPAAQPIIPPYKKTAPGGRLYISSTTPPESLYTALP